MGPKAQGSRDSQVSNPSYFHGIPHRAQRHQRESAEQMWPLEMADDARQELCCVVGGSQSVGLGGEEECLRDSNLGLFCHEIWIRLVQREERTIR